MSLCDSFSEPPAKTPNNVWRSNAHRQLMGGFEHFKACFRARAAPS